MEFWKLNLKEIGFWKLNLKEMKFWKLIEGGIYLKNCLKIELLK